MPAKKAAKKVSKPAAKKAAKKAPAKAVKATKATKKTAKKTPTKAAKKAAKAPAKAVTEIPEARTPPLVKQITGPEAHAPVDTIPPIIDEDTIRTAAYLNYSNRTSTGGSGDALGDWLAAETSLKK